MKILYLNIFKFVSETLKYKVLNKKLLVYFFGFNIIACFLQCAQVVSPTGGPKDEIPPKLIISNPKVYSINYNSNEIELFFDEYIKLNNIDQKLLVSPPLKYKPVTKLRGKSLLIELEDTLVDNTTYTFNFSDAIVDNNEGNPIDNFEFVFSTGDELDSLSVKGVVLDAFTHEPKEDILVMLYKNLNDSAPLLELPFHLLKTDANGQFEINNVKNSTFKIFVLGDENANYLFDLPEEFIAFSDDYVNFESRVIERTDSIFPDSVVTTQFNVLLADSIKLYLFQEDYKKQYLVNSERKIYRKLDFLFNRSLYYDSLKMDPINFNAQVDWKLIETNQGMDTISYWITDTLISKMDTISVELSYLKLDSLNELIWISDTVNLGFEFKKEEEKKSKKKRDRTAKRAAKSEKTLKKSDRSLKVEAELERMDSSVVNEIETVDTLVKPKIEYLKLLLNVKNNSTFDLGKSIIITSPTPVFEYTADKIKFFLTEDSLEFPREIEMIEDSIKSRRFILSNDLEGNSGYKLVIEPRAFTDIYGLFNDTVIVSFSTRELEYYGAIILNLTGVNSNLLLQLLDKEEKIIKQLEVKESKTINFLHLAPKEYKLKIIYDSNNNLKWDTGYYIENIQPEKVIYYKKIVNVRSNWDFELNWNLEDDTKNHNND